MARGMQGGLVLALALVAIAPQSAPAHPLGNFSINHYAALRVAAAEVEIAYIIDMAEIPTFQEIQTENLVPDVAHPSVAPYLARTTEALRERLHVEIDGRPRPLRTLGREVHFPPGAGDLPTLRLHAVYRVDLGGAPATSRSELRYRDENFPGRAGWKEIVAVAGPGARLAASSAPGEDRSRRLSDYPTDLLNSPPQDLEARVVFAVAPPPATVAASAAPLPERVAPPGRAAPPAPRPPTGDLGPLRAPPDGPPPPAVAPPPERLAAASATPRSAFTQLMASRELSVGIIALALATALGVGAVHALEPGHGKALVAAYLVGARGTARHAVFLGLVVTASHTAGVFLLGLITLYASRYVVPERLYPWLGAISGLTIAGLGFWLLVQRVARGAGGDHRHHHHDVHHHHHGAGGPHHDHHHDEHGHGGRGHHHHDAPARLRELFALGLTGGIVPCPAALVVLLSAIALRRTGLGLMLIVAFSVGLAAVLVGIGLLMVYARRFMARVQGDGPVIRRWLPLASAAIIMVLGAGIAVQALLAAGIVQIRL